MQQPTTFDRHAARRDLTGKTYGRLTALRWTRDERGVVWVCQCSCGNVCIKTTANLIRHARSCGCLKRETAGHQSLIHGHARSGAVSPEHCVWRRAIGRCTNPSNRAYRNYGGRGITVDERWLGDDGFVHFLHDMGPRPGPDYSLDRINNDGPYAPGNCRWATRKQQARNVRSNHLLEYKGETAPLSELAERCHLGCETVRRRLLAGWTVEAALETPVTLWPSDVIARLTTEERTALEARFWRKVDRSAGPDGCWPWTRGRTRGSYGRFSIRHGEQEYAHRVAWQLAHGPIPAGQQVLHSCDVRFRAGDVSYRLCCNERHLHLGTQAENLAEMVAKGRRHTNREDRT